MRSRSSSTAAASQQRPLNRDDLQHPSSLHTLSSERGVKTVGNQRHMMMQSHFEFGKCPTPPTLDRSRAFRPNTTLSKDSPFNHHHQQQQQQHDSSSSGGGSSSSGDGAGGAEKRPTTGRRNSATIQELGHMDRRILTSSVQFIVQPESMPPRVECKQGQRTRGRYDMEQHVVMSERERSIKENAPLEKTQRYLQEVKKEQDRLGRLQTEQPHFFPPRLEPRYEKVDQKEFSKSVYATKPIWKSRDREFSTFKI